MRRLNISLSSLSSVLFPSRSLYAFSIFIAGLACIAGLGFFLFWTYGYISAIGIKTSYDLGTNSTDLDTAAASGNYIMMYIGVVLAIILGIWVLVYCQKKGNQVA